MAFFLYESAERKTTIAALCDLAEMRLTCELVLEMWAETRWAKVNGWRVGSR